MNKILMIFLLGSFAIQNVGCNSSDTLPNTLTIGDIKLELIKCPAGNFNMGSSEKALRTFGSGDQIIIHKRLFGFEYNEREHLVTISEPYYIGKYEVTQNQYKTITGLNPSKNIGENNPVESITYEEAKVFCEKLNIKYKDLIPNGFKFDLPTEAQWEYSCRAGSKSSFSNGSEMSLSSILSDEKPNINEICWYIDNSGDKSHLVGQKKPNAWGIHDMHGNVYEYCRDYYDSYSDKEVTDPYISKAKTISRVIRGGGYNTSEIECRSANRRAWPEVLTNDNLGFRIALVPINQK